jgi:two-component system sensor histidine kinase AlgZ
MAVLAGIRSDTERAEYLPDFCRPGAVLALVLISELVALVLTLGRPRAIPDASFWGTMANTSLFLLWIGLSGAAVLCYMRPALARRSVARATAAALILLVAVTGLISEAAWWLGGYWAFLGAPTARPLPMPGHLMFVLGNMAIALIVSALALRYFYVSHQWRRNVELEATSRVNALQARIRPHFLFNSLNTIAALTRRDPGLAEEAIEDLADLFRASLRDSSARMSLKEDMEIARLYQRIEQHRLGARLNVDWKVDALPMRTQIPGLSLQPLLENAIYHGIEPLTGGGTVDIEGKLIGDDRVQIRIRNPMPVGQPAARREGNRMALDNISERFRIAYGGRARVEYGPSGQHYEVVLEFPRTEPG